MGAPEAEKGKHSPLLANLAIGNLEDIGAKYQKSGRDIRNNGIPGIRYADDLVFITKTEPKPKGKPRNSNPEITEYLSERGLRVKEAKTRIIKATQGFDFLGWHRAG